MKTYDSLGQLVNASIRKGSGMKTYDSLGQLVNASTRKDYGMKTYDSLEQLVNARRTEYRAKHPDGDFPDENLIWAVQDYLSMFGSFTPEDRKYLADNGNSCLTALEDEIEDDIEDESEDEEYLPNDSEETDDVPDYDSIGTGDGERVSIRIGEGGIPLAVFPDIPWGADASRATGWNSVDGHVPVDEAVSRAMPEADRATAMETMRQLHEIGYGKLMLILD